MSLSRADWEELLTHTRMRVREAGLTEIDVHVTMDFRSSQSPSQDFRNYLGSVINAVGERSYSGYRRAMDIFRESVKTEDGTEISGIEVRVGDQDFGVYRASTIRLDDQVDLTALVSALKRLQGDLEQAGLFDE
jgi:hypothetical protein